MKKRIGTAAMLLLSFVFCLAQNSHVKFIPDQPAPGSVIRFEYTTNGTTLGGENDFDAIAYILDGEVRAQEVKLTMNASKWVGEIHTNDSTMAVFIVFLKGDLIDNNREKGYFISMYKNGEPVKGAASVIAGTETGIGSFLMQLKADPKEVAGMFEGDFKKYPELSNKWLPNFTLAVMKSDKDNAQHRLQPYIDAIMNKPVKTEKDYEALIGVYQQLRDKVNSTKIQATAVKEFPKGDFAKGNAIDAIFAEQDLKKKEALLSDFTATYPALTDNDNRNLNNIYGIMAATAAQNKDWVAVDQYIAKMNDKTILANAYNTIAWAETGEGLDGIADDLNKAKELSAKSLELTQQEIDHPSNPSPFFTSKQTKKNGQTTWAGFADTYALVLWKLGQSEEAYNYQAKAANMMGMKDMDINERYILYKEKAKGTDAVKEEIAEMAKSGKATPKMKEILKNGYMAGGHTEAEYASYMDGLIKEAHERMRIDLMKKMISEAAPKFALLDLSGNKIALEDLKGKVVVVDFWATWCGPCRASFPGMQMALDKYKDDPNVRFVFVDTWESKKSDEMLKEADEFIRKNKYDFQVLLDTDDKVIGSYAVDGIPTKFIIDPESNIRFKAVGYSGNPEQLADEMSIMIDALKNGQGNGTKKGF